MDLVFAQLLGLGKAPSAFGVTLALILTWVVLVAGLVVALVWFTMAQARSEHKENVQRAADFDARHYDSSQ